MGVKRRSSLLLCAALVFSMQPSEAGPLVLPAEELASLFAADQADRNATGKPIDWEAVSMRDEHREMRVKQLLREGTLASGLDYYHAAMVLQHAPTPEDSLLAHDLCVVAISKGEARAKWLAAASLDRYLMKTGRLQRFATQYANVRPGNPPALYPVDQSVPDSLRRELDVPTLEQAIAHQKELADQANAIRSEVRK